MIFGWCYLRDRDIDVKDLVQWNHVRSRSQRTVRVDLQTNDINFETGRKGYGNRNRIRHNYIRQMMTSLFKRQVLLL